MALLEVRGAALGYEGRAVVEGLSFSVEAGDYLAIVGENGSGKTTLMRTLLGLQKPLNGRVAFGEGLSGRAIGYMPQQTQTQRDFPATVWEIALSGCLGRLGRRPFYGRPEKALVRENLERMGVWELRERSYRSLSGGQQQRVLLARALSATRKMLLLDEPVTGLDPMVTQELYQLIQAINREDGVTILMVSHDVAAVARYATHILHVGSKLFFGTVDEYRASPLGRAFLAEETA